MHHLIVLSLTRGIIDIPTTVIDPITEKPTESPITEVPDPITTVAKETEQNQTDVNPEVEPKNVDDFFAQINENITHDEGSSQDLTQAILDDIKQDNFVLSTSDHILKTVALTEKLGAKIDSELDAIKNKTVATAKRVTFTQQLCTILSALMETKNEQCWKNTETEKTPVYATQIISQTEQFGLNLACELEQNSSIPIDADSIQMEVFAFENHSYINQEVAFPSKQTASSQVAQIKFPSGKYLHPTLSQLFDITIGKLVYYI